MKSDEVLQYLYGHQWAIPPLRLCLDYHQKYGGGPFRWANVRVSQPDLNRLVLAGLADKLENGKYALVDPAEISKAVGLLMFQRTQVKAQTKAAPPGTLQLPPGLPPDLFSDIIGYNDVKRDIAYALNAKGRIHILLHGPPATAKSMFLEAIAELPGAVLRFGDGMSKAGVRETIIREQPSFLCIDELEKMDRKDDTILLELMEHGTVSMMHYGASDMVESPVRVFAACNNINVLRPELRSRFLKLQIREYTKEEFVQVATSHLIKKGASAAIAKYIAEGVGVKTRDLRDAIRIASMAQSMADAVYLVGRLGEEASVL